MFNWLREWYELRREFNNPPCTSCENLKSENERLRQDNAKLLDRILAVPEKPEEPTTNTRSMLPVSNAHIPWRIRQQMLEAEDREKARLLRNAPKPVPTTDLEEALGVAEQERTSGN